MRDQLGSHWRWRFLLLVVLLLTLAGARSQAPQWNVMIVPGGGERIVAVSQRREQVKVMALDQAAGRFRDLVRLEAKDHPASFRVVRERTAIAWRQFHTLHIADIDAPERTKSWSVPGEVGWSTIEGISSDERFAVFQKAVQVSGNTHQYSTNVVDLSNGQVVSTEEWASPIESTDKPNEFRGSKIKDSKDGTEPVTSLWKLTSAGQWERLESKSVPSFSPYQEVRLARSPQGTMRRLAKDEKPAALETEVAGVVSAVSPSGYVLVDPLVGLRGRVLIGRWDSSELVPTETILGYAGISFPKDDAAAVVNFSDDVELLDLTTGKTTTMYSFGTHRKWVLGAFAVGIAGLVAMWTWLGARERSSWWLFDSSIAMVIMPLVPLVWFTANFQAWRMATSVAFLFAYQGFTVGMIAGTSIMVGWYWAYGSGRATVRWIVGGLLLCTVCACLSEQVVNELLGQNHSPVEGMAIVWAVCQSASIVVAGLVAILLLATKTFGVAVSNVPLEAPTNRFTLTSLFVATIGVSMLLAVASAVSNEFQFIGMLWFLAPALAAILIGSLIVSLILSRSISTAAAHVTALLVLLLATWSIARASLGPLGWIPASGWIFGAGLAGAILPIVIAGFLARCHGWRWMQAARLTAPLPEGDAAHESAPQATNVDRQPVLG